MRFIGNKEKLLDVIYKTTTDLGIKSGRFCDFFSGTSNVGRYFKEQGFSIISSDLLYFSYVLQKAYIENNIVASFKKLHKKISSVETDFLISDPLQKVLFYLNNNLESVEGFIYKNYTEEGTKNTSFVRKYFTGENGKIIDTQRQQIEKWKIDNLITENEYFILLACLIESVPFYANISGVYAAFLKGYDPRALKRFKIRPIQLYQSNNKHQVYNKNSMELIPTLRVDILYIDPPYNERQYAPNYHLLETIAKYDNPQIKGVTGMRDYTDQKSDFCNPTSALKSLEKIAGEASYKHLLLSYNSEGIMPREGILEVLGKFGNVQLKEMDYLRFKSNSNGEAANKKHIQEQIYLLNRK